MRTEVGMFYLDIHFKNQIIMYELFYQSRLFMCWLPLSLYFAFILFIYLHLVTTTVCDGCNRPKSLSCLCLTGSPFRGLHCSSSSSHLWYIWICLLGSRKSKNWRQTAASPLFFLLSNRDLTSVAISYYVSRNQRRKKNPKQDFEELNPVFACMVLLS